MSTRLRTGNGVKGSVIVACCHDFVSTKWKGGGGLEIAEMSNWAAMRNRLFFLLLSLFLLLLVLFTAWAQLFDSCDVSGIRFFCLCLSTSYFLIGRLMNRGFPWCSIRLLMRAWSSGEILTLLTVQANEIIIFCCQFSCPRRIEIISAMPFITTTDAVTALGRASQFYVWLCSRHPLGQEQTWLLMALIDALTQ
jgi:hypothetical protein